MCLCLRGLIGNLMKWRPDTKKRHKCKKTCMPKRPTKMYVCDLMDFWAPRSHVNYTIAPGKCVNKCVVRTAKVRERYLIAWKRVTFFVRAQNAGVFFLVRCPKKVTSRLAWKRIERTTCCPKKHNNYAGKRALERWRTLRTFPDKFAHNWYCHHVLPQASRAPQVLSTSKGKAEKKRYCGLSSLLAFRVQQLWSEKMQVIPNKCPCPCFSVYREIPPLHKEKYWHALILFKRGIGAVFAVAVVPLPLGILLEEGPRL